MKRALLLVVLACGTHTAQPWETDEARAFARARREGKGVLVNVYASYSVPDVELAHHLEAPSVARAIDRSFVRLRLDVSNDDAPELDDRYQIKHATPQVILMSADATLLDRIVGLVEPDALVRAIEKAR